MGAARGLQYLHCVANPPVIYRDLKSANILLDNNLHPKLSDFGLAKLGPVGDNTHVSTRVMGTYGYCAPEYAMSGKLTLKSDIYCFGVVLLELITGRKAMDVTRKQREQSLVAWVNHIYIKYIKCYIYSSLQMGCDFDSRLGHIWATVGRFRRLLTLFWKETTPYVVCRMQLLSLQCASRSNPIFVHP